MATVRKQPTEEETRRVFREILKKREAEDKDKDKAEAEKRPADEQPD